MAKDRIKILGDWGAWAESVRQGRLIRPDGEAVWILLRCRPELAYSDAQWKTEKVNSRLISRVDHPAVLRLLHASKVEGAPAWIHEGFQGVSLARVLDVFTASGDFFSARAAIEVVERTVQGMRAALSQGRNFQGAQGPVYHPGPSPSELLTDAVGSVKLAGFAIESSSAMQMPTAEGYAPVQPGTPEQRGVYGLAALLVHLLGGERPGTAGADTGRQDAVIRRSVIRVLARPGEAVPESIIELIKAGLAFDPDDRPEFTTMEDALAQAASELRSVALRTWAPTAVPGLLQQQEAGYPDGDSARIRRHIDLSDDSSYDAPPVRVRAKEAAPREVATVLANVDVAAALAAAEEDSLRENLGLVSQTSFGSIPTSETDVKVATAGLLAAEHGEPAPVQLDIGGPEDTWELEPESEGKMGGWPLIAGLLIGMVVAAIVGWVAVEHMVEQAPTATEQAPMLTAPVQPVPPPAPPEVVPEEAPPADEVDENANEELAAEAEDSVQAEEVQEPVEPPVDVPEVEVVPPPPPPAPTPPPAVVERQAAAPLAPAAPVPDVFTVTFRNGSPTIDRLVVRCHKGGVGEGAEVVHIAGAGKGPCRVEGYTGSEKIAVSAILMGPQNFTCFEGNARLCR